jgi:adenylylsulfate kinase-like enzyme
MDTQSPGFVVWVTGMRKAGKSLLAARLVERFQGSGRPAVLIDEGGEAKILVDGLGPLKDAQATSARRLGFVAKGVAHAGGVAVVAALSPYRDAREALRKELRRFAEVFVDCPMEKLMERDREGLYKKAMNLEVTQVPGIDLPYEPPAHAEAVVRSDQGTVDAEVVQVLQALVDAKLIGPAEFGRLTGGQRPRRRSAGKRPDRQARPAARKAPKKAAARTARAARSRR